MKTILIIKHGALGDVILSMYAIFSISQYFKGYHISILTESKYEDIFNKLPFIKDIRIDNRKKIYSFIHYLGLINWFYKESFEWVFDLQTSKRTKLYFLIFTLFRKCNWNGISKNCSHPHLNLERKYLHTVERQKQQLKCAGLHESRKPDWNLFKKVNKKFKYSKPYVILVPGGSKHRENKRWCYDNFLLIVSHLRKKNIQVLFIGGSDEKKILKNYKKKKGVINLIGKTNFTDLAYLSDKASMIIGNDTGPMHILVACSNKKTKKIILFGEASDPNLCAPIGENVKIIRKKNINDIKPKLIIDLINENNYSKL